MCINLFLSISFSFCVIYIWYTPKQRGQVNKKACKAHKKSQANGNKKNMRMLKRRNQRIKQIQMLFIISHIAFFVLVLLNGDLILSCMEPELYTSNSYFRLITIVNGILNVDDNCGRRYRKKKLGRHFLFRDFLVSVYKKRTTG